MADGADRWASPDALKTLWPDHCSHENISIGADSSLECSLLCLVTGLHPTKLQALKYIPQ